MDFSSMTNRLRFLSYIQAIYYICQVCVTGKIIVVSNRLPVTLTKENGEFKFKISSGGLISGLEGVKEVANFTWIGWPGFEVEEHEQERLSQQLEKEANCKPVFLTEEVSNLYYKHYCNEVLWPLLHNFIDKCKYREEYFIAYRTANRIFFSKIEEILEDGDLVWIHDYHLMLLPAHIRGLINSNKKYSNVKISFFLHTIFPATEIFELIPHHLEIVESLLMCDMVAFHVQRYVINFLNTCQLLLDAKRIDNGLAYKGRSIKIVDIPLGIHPEKFANQLKTDETKNYKKQIREKYKGKTLIIGVDRVDYIKALETKYNAFDLLLESNKDLADKVVFIQIAIPSRGSNQDYNDYASKLQKLCMKINNKHKISNENIIEFNYHSVDFDYLVALYNEADILVVSSVVDGMNLVAHEFIAASDSGILIVSRSTGCSSLLNTTFKFNTNDEEELRNFYIEAINYDKTKAKDLNSQLKNTIAANSSPNWARKNLQEIGFIIPK